MALLTQGEMDTEIAALEAYLAEQPANDLTTYVLYQRLYALKWFNQDASISATTLAQVDEIPKVVRGMKIAHLDEAKWSNEVQN